MEQPINLKKTRSEGMADESSSATVAIGRNSSFGSPQADSPAIDSSQGTDDLRTHMEGGMEVSVEEEDYSPFGDMEVDFLPDPVSKAEEIEISKGYKEFTLDLPIMVGTNSIQKHILISNYCEKLPHAREECTPEWQVIHTLRCRKMESWVEETTLNEFKEDSEQFRHLNDTFKLGAIIFPIKKSLHSARAVHKIRTKIPSHTPSGAEYEAEIIRYVVMLTDQNRLLVDDYEDELRNERGSHLYFRGPMGDEMEMSATFFSFQEFAQNHLGIEAIAIPSNFVLGYMQASQDRGMYNTKRYVKYAVWKVITRRANFGTLREKLHLLPNPMTWTKIQKPRIAILGPALRIEVTERIGDFLTHKAPSSQLLPSIQGPGGGKNVIVISGVDREEAKGISDLINKFVTNKCFAKNAVILAFVEEQMDDRYAIFIHLRYQINSDAISIIRGYMKAATVKLVNTTPGDDELARIITELSNVAEETYKYSKFSPSTPSQSSRSYSSMTASTNSGPSTHTERKPTRVEEELAEMRVAQRAQSEQIMLLSSGITSMQAKMSDYEQLRIQAANTQETTSQCLQILCAMMTGGSGTLSAGAKLLEVTADGTNSDTGRRISIGAGAGGEKTSLRGGNQKVGLGRDRVMDEDDPDEHWAHTFGSSSTFGNQILSGKRRLQRINYCEVDRGEPLPNIDLDLELITMADQQFIIIDGHRTSVGTGLFGTSKSDKTFKSGQFLGLYPGPTISKSEMERVEREGGVTEYMMSDTKGGFINGDPAICPGAKLNYANHFNGLVDAKLDSIPQNIFFQGMEDQEGTPSVGVFLSTDIHAAKDVPFHLVIDYSGGKSNSTCSSYFPNKEIAREHLDIRTPFPNPRFMEITTKRIPTKGVTLHEQDASNIRLLTELTNSAGSFSGGRLKVAQLLIPWKQLKKIPEESIMDHFTFRLYRMAPKFHQQDISKASALIALLHSCHDKGPLSGRQRNKEWMTEANKVMEDAYPNFLDLAQCYYPPTIIEKFRSSSDKIPDWIKKGIIDWEEDDILRLLLAFNGSRTIWTPAEESMGVLTWVSHEHKQGSFLLSELQSLPTKSMIYRGPDHVYVPYMEITSYETKLTAASIALGGAIRALLQSVDG